MEALAFLVDNLRHFAYCSDEFADIRAISHDLRVKIHLRTQLPSKYHAGRKVTVSHITTVFPKSILGIRYPHEASRSNLTRIFCESHIAELGSLTIDTSTVEILASLDWEGIDHDDPRNELGIISDAMCVRTDFRTSIVMYFITYHLYRSLKEFGRPQAGVFGWAEAANVIIHFPANWWVHESHDIGSIRELFWKFLKPFRKGFVAQISEVESTPDTAQLLVMSRWRRQRFIAEYSATKEGILWSRWSDLPRKVKREGKCHSMEEDCKTSDFVLPYFP